MEKKKRIAKAVARSEAARAAVALMREEMRAHPQGPGESMPSTNRGPVVHMEGEPTATQGFGVSSEYKSPSHVTRMMNECHDTWQRGVKAIELNKQLPMATSTSGAEKGAWQDDQLSPLMHGMMIPHFPPKSAPRPPPDTPFTELNSSTSSLYPNRNRLQLTI